MSTVPEGQDDQPDRDADARADAMKAQLRKDVKSWSRARNELPRGTLSSQCCGGQADFAQAGPPSQGSRSARRPRRRRQGQNQNPIRCRTTEARLPNTFST